MSGAHAEIGPELRRLAQAILDGIDPAVRAAAAFTAGGGAGTGRCQQVWCPVCALAALAGGEQHPLLTVIADHSVALMEVIRGIVGDVRDAGGAGVADSADTGGADQAGETGRSAEPPPGGGPPGGAGSAGATRYQPIPITVEE
ncbi:MAG: hypothetical protein WCI78_07530 [Mycobacterium sp.]